METASDNEALTCQRESFHLNKSGLRIVKSERERRARVRCALSHSPSPPTPTPRCRGSFLRLPPFFVRFFLFHSSAAVVAIVLGTSSAEQKLTHTYAYACCRCAIATVLVLALVE